MFRESKNDCQNQQELVELSHSLDEAQSHKKARLEIVPTSSVIRQPSPGPEGQSTLPAAFLQTIERGLTTLIHSASCSSGTCAVESCKKMKLVGSHASVCKIKPSECKICKYFYRLCLHHAMQCNESHCILRVCPIIKLIMQRRQFPLQDSPILEPVTIK